jgi:alpha-galactosidase
MGEHFNEQVLLVKTCWGGRSVKKDFLPPSAGMPSDEVLQQELENRKKKNPDATLEEVKAGYGKAYRDTIEETKRVLANLKNMFPGGDKREYELAGFVFFQGWNDMIDGEQRAEKYATYTKRLALLIKDVRKDLGVPNLPVVIGGMGAAEEGDFQAAQKAAADLPEFKGNVSYVGTRRFWEPEVEELLKQGLWKGPDWVKFYNVGSEKGYHYLGSAKMLYSIGEAFGEGMIGMLKD